MNELDSKKVVLITGCSSGIGFATAVQFTKNDFVTFPTMRDLVKKNKLAEQLPNPENILQLDVTDDESINTTVSKIMDIHGRIDVLINNAGFGLFGSFEDTTIEEFKQQMDTNFFGTIRLIKKILPIMKKNNQGKIINISSIAGISGFPFISAHNSSAFALEGLTESLRYELKKFGIQISIVEMGGVNTNFFDNKILTKNALHNEEYQTSMKNYLNMLENIVRNTIPPEVVAEKILEIEKMDSLEPRYVVGEDAQLISNQKQILSPSEYEKYILDFILQGILDD